MLPSLEAGGAVGFPARLCPGGICATLTMGSQGNLGPGQDGRSLLLASPLRAAGSGAVPSATPRMGQCLVVRRSPKVWKATLAGTLHDPA